MLSSTLRATSRAVQRRSFSIEAAAQTSYDRFRSAYVRNLDKMSSTAAEEKLAEEPVCETAYEGIPNHDEYSPMFMNPFNQERFFDEFVGPEMVSPHYENFSMSRKWALLTVGSYLSLNYLGRVTDLAWILQSMMIPWMLYLSASYFSVEGKKSILMPLQYEFYHTISKHEADLMMAYWPDEVRENIRHNLAVAREQMQYYEVHTDFADMKAESVNRFLANEQVNLKVHVHQRAETILKEAYAIEQNNQNRYVTKVVTEAVKAVDETLENNMDQIKEAMFESALVGIRNKKMTYENDPILPLVLETIRARVQEVKNLSAEEQKSLVTLTADQLAGLKNNDKRARESFLETQPLIDGSLKDYSQVQEALNNWGK